MFTYFSWGKNDILMDLKLEDMDDLLHAWIVAESTRIILETPLYLDEWPITNYITNERRVGDILQLQQ